MSESGKRPGSVWAAILVLAAVFGAAWALLVLLGLWIAGMVHP